MTDFKYEITQEIGVLSESKSGWKRETGKTVYIVEIPANTTATFILPDGTVQALLPGQHTIQA